ncbi:Glyoxylase, beta-lactamase superfamily II [Loktanella fryxellensis]|uniref:Glyoxylase, beta-lactamase superfamily II n=1 Tax=Loktanella fryxellensis TaxID=245187 RepID=A0A1H8FI42_9RHOB|nr:MBL fold metallo-hydrolase [Loktanella fryxellensis]SEN31403.1 Glyoxylase, beta-lactamase superfamily II [Loktanella fryxellensis]
MTIRTPFADPPAPGCAVTVAPGVLWMRMALPMALDHVNVYALDDGCGWTLIDTGFDTPATRAAWQTLLAGPLAGRPVTRLIVTHHHPDHVGLAGWFVAQGAALWMSRTAWLMARMLTLDVQATATPAQIAFWQRAGMDAAILDQRRTARPFNFADCVHPMPLGFNRLCEGDTIRMGGRTWDIRMGDGHAPEHATFWSRDDDLVIGGDQLLLSISPNLGVYPTEPDADPVGDWIASCTRFQSHARADQLILGGHKLPYTGLPQRLIQMIDNHHAALDRLALHLDVPRAAGDCFAPLFKRPIGADTYGLALVEAVAHLNHLHRTGRATRTLGPDNAWTFQAIR